LKLPLAALDHSIGEMRAQAKMRIIVAEDNKINQIVLKKMLEKLHNDIFVAENGKICVQEYIRSLEQNEPYHLILMDIQMPEMNGIDATREIRRIESEKGIKAIKIMAITAFVTEQDRQDCFDAGMNGFISKPVTPTMLSDVLLEIQNT
jgi:CheY-like chemotaxis protein